MITMPKWLKTTFFSTGWMVCFAFMSPAYADNCTALNQNPDWNIEFALLNDAYKQEDWKNALEHAKILEQICDESPVLNYTIARIHHNMGNNEKYLYYLQKSTLNTEKFVVDKDLLDRIWSEKYIAAHPEADPETIKLREQTIFNQSNEINALKEELKTVQNTADNAIKLKEEVNSAHTSDEAWLWTGVATAAAGLILTGVGAYFVAANHDKSVNSDDKGYFTKKEYNMGWTLLGAGIGMTVVGSIAMGFFGYRYRMDHQNDQTNELSFTLSPSYSSLSFTF